MLFPFAFGFLSFLFIPPPQPLQLFHVITFQFSHVVTHSWFLKTFIICKRFTLQPYKYLAKFPLPFQVSKIRFFFLRVFEPEAVPNDQHCLYFLYENICFLMPCQFFLHAFSDNLHRLSGTLHSQKHIADISIKQGLYYLLS